MKSKIFNSNQIFNAVARIRLILFASIVVIFSCKKEQFAPEKVNNVSSLKNRPENPHTIPITAASFPKEVIDVYGGRIDFWAKMPNYSGYITVGGREPQFFYIYDGQSEFFAGFNSNDGAGNGGLTGAAASKFRCGTGYYGSYTYENVFGIGNVEKWHHYQFVWSKIGDFETNQPTHKVEIFIDSKLNTGRWQAVTGSLQKFLPLTDGSFNLITTENNPLTPVKEIIMDELKIYDRHNHLILSNSLGSQYEIEHSSVGLNGSFNGGGSAHFVPGIVGNALAAQPVWGTQD